MSVERLEMNAPPVEPDQPLPPKLSPSEEPRK